MNKSLAGKKLLILGGSPDEIDLVKRAQQLGVYVVVADYYTDMRISPAKLIADEAWDVSWSDIDTLAQMCREHEIDGVTAGYSEVRIDMLIRLCRELRMPCYATEEQLEITRDKVKFKNTCRKNGVPVVKEYASVEDVDEYPVIVKPVDRGGSIGISVANDYDELVKAYDYAMGMSLTKHVIIEKYITAQKMDVYYAIEDGVATLITTNDAIMAKDNGTDRVVQSAWVYPHKYADTFVKKEDGHLKAMIADMGIRYGCIFFSGFCDENQDYTFFECGFRLEGGHQYEYANRRGFMNFNDLFIFHALTGSTVGLERGTEFNPDLKMATINFYGKEGIVGKIEGAEKVELMNDCTMSLIYSYEGQKCSMANAILRKIGMFSFANEDSNAIADDVANAYKTFIVTDKNGNDLIYDRIDPNTFRNWWSK